MRIRSLLLSRIAATMALAVPLTSHKRQSVDRTIGSVAARISTIIGTGTAAGELAKRKGEFGSCDDHLGKITQEVRAVVAEDTG